MFARRIMDHSLACPSRAAAQCVERLRRKPAPGLLAACGLAALLAGCATRPGPTVATTPALTAGPGDVMRPLPQRLALRQRPPCAAQIAVSASQWRGTLAHIAALLQALDTETRLSPDNPLPSVALCHAGTRATPLDIALWSVLLHARDVERLRFAQSPLLPVDPGTDARPSRTVSGASFLGPEGSQVLVINRGTRTARVRLGTWVRKEARLEQFRAAPLATISAILAPQQASVTLPPESLSIVR